MVYLRYRGLIRHHPDKTENIDWLIVRRNNFYRVVGRGCHNLDGILGLTFSRSFFTTSELRAKKPSQGNP